MNAYRIHGNVEHILNKLEGLVFDYEYYENTLFIYAEPTTLKLINKIIIFNF